MTYIEKREEICGRFSIGTYLIRPRDHKAILERSGGGKIGWGVFDSDTGYTLVSTIPPSLGYKNKSDVPPNQYLGKRREAVGLAVNLHKSYCRERCKLRVEK